MPGVGVCGRCGSPVDPNALDVDVHTGQFTVDGTVVREGDLISIDGSTGHVYLGEVPVRPSPVARHLEEPSSTVDDPLVRAVDRLLDHVRVAVGDGVERAWIEGNAGHAFLLPRRKEPGKPTLE